MDWFEEHVYVAQWLGPAATFSAVLVALFGPQWWGWWRQPKLTLEFEPGEPCVRTTELTNGVLTEWTRVRVRNTGRTSAQRCVPMLVRVASNGAERKDIDPIQLRWAGIPRSRGFDPVNLARGDFAYFNVLRQQENEKVARFESFDYPDLDTGFLTVLPLSDSHKLTVTVTSDTARPASYQLHYARTEPVLRFP